MKKRASMAVIAGLLSAVALSLSAQQVFAAVNWAGPWSPWAPAGKASACPPAWAGAQAGTGAVNGNDVGQALAWCYANGAWTCGTQGGQWQFFVRTEGYNISLNQFEFTGGSNGPSVGSTAGGYRIDQTSCQEGYQAL
jgi:hypothetical protein